MKYNKRKLKWSTIVVIEAWTWAPGYDDSVDKLLANAIDVTIPKQMENDNIKCDGAGIVFTPIWPSHKTSNVNSDTVIGDPLEVKFMLFEDGWGLYEVEIPSVEAHQIIEIKNRIFKLLKLEEV